MKKNYLVVLIISCLLFAVLLSYSNLNVNANTTEESFFSVRDYSTKLDSKIIDGKRYYFVLDEMQLLIFDDNLTFVKKVGHIITGDYDFKIINDIDNKGSNDILLIMKPDREFNSEESGPSLATYSFETGNLIWYKYLTIEELFSKQETIFYAGDYQINENNLIVSYGYVIEKINLLTGKSKFKKVFNNNIWTVSYINDINNDGVLDLVINEQPNHVMIIDGNNGSVLKQSLIGEKLKLANGNITPNIWSLRFNDSSNLIGAVTDTGIFYEVDTNLNLKFEYEFYSITNQTQFNKYIEQGYTDGNSGWTYKNAELHISDDLDGDGMKDYLIIYNTLEEFWVKKIAIYYKNNKQINYKDEFKSISRYLENGNVIVEAIEGYPRYSTFNLKTGVINNINNIYTPESWSNDELTLNRFKSYLELSRGNDVISKTLIENKETFKRSKYLYRYDEYGAIHRYSYIYRERPHFTKQFIQYDELMNERFKFTSDVDEWIYEFNPIDKNENLIFIHTGNDNGTHRFRLYEVGKDEPLKDYTISEPNWDNIITTIPIFNLNSSNDFILKVSGETFNDDVKVPGSIEKINLNTNEIVTLDNISVEDLLAGEVERVDIHYDFETNDINSYIFERYGNVAKLSTNQNLDQVLMQTYEADIFLLEKVEPISDLDGDGWNDYQIIETKEVNSSKSALFLTGSENPVINSHDFELFSQSPIDFNEDGINDFVGVTLSQEKITFFIYTYDPVKKELVSYWTFDEDIRFGYTAVYKPIAAIDKDHIMFYEIQSSGDVELHKVNIRTNKKSTIKLFNDYNHRQHLLGGMIHAMNQYVMFEYNNKIFITKDDKLVSVVKGDLIYSYYDTVLIEDKSFHTLYMSNINDVNKNVTYKFSYFGNLKIDLSDFDFEIARILSGNYWKEFETSQKRFDYIIHGKWNLIMVETFDQEGNISFHVFKITKLSLYIKLGVFILSIGLITIMKKLYAKRQKSVKGEM